MSSQEHKQFLGIAGEFLVAGELNRRWISAGISFGHSKKGDIFIYNTSKQKILRVEVKTTCNQKWLVGAKILEEKNWTDDWFWTLVHFPARPGVEAQLTDNLRGKNAPRYYVMTGQELGTIVSGKQKAYFAKYKVKHGRDYTKVSVPTVDIKEVEQYENDWSKIQSAYLFTTAGRSSVI